MRDLPHFPHMSALRVVMIAINAPLCEVLIMDDNFYFSILRHVGTHLYIFGQIMCL